MKSRRRARSRRRGRPGGHASRVDDDQIAWLGGVNRLLDRARGGDVGGGFAANGDRHGVDRLLAIAGSNDELTAPCLGASVLRLLLNGAERNLAHRARGGYNRGVGPA